MTPYELIVKCREKLDLPSDYAAAKRLGLTKGAISIIKTRGTGFNNETAWKVAEILEMDPAEVIAVCELARAESSDDEERVAMWKRRFQAVTHSPATIFGLIAIPYWAEVANKFCILCQIAGRGRFGGRWRFSLDL